MRDKSGVRMYLISVLVLLYFVGVLQTRELAKCLLLYRLQDKNIPKILSEMLNVCDMETAILYCKEL